MRPDILWLWEGEEGAVENVCGMHLKYGYNVCKISWVSQAKKVSKCNRIASLFIFNYNIFMGETPQTPITRGGVPPPVLSSHSCRWHAVNVDGLQWPYHFPKTDDGPVLLAILKANVGRGM